MPFVLLLTHRDDDLHRRGLAGTAKFSSIDGRTNESDPVRSLSSSGLFVTDCRLAIESACFRAAHHLVFCSLVTM